MLRKVHYLWVVGAGNNRGASEIRRHEKGGANYFNIPQYGGGAKKFGFCQFLFQTFLNNIFSGHIFFGLSGWGEIFMTRRKEGGAKTF